ncbi:MAG: hypothetical protein IJU52_09915, partial [Clostridia bacterium]|nr:hypothetical protein [Clostridia bacterium]
MHRASAAFSYRFILVFSTFCSRFAASFSAYNAAHGAHMARMARSEIACGTTRQAVKSLRGEIEHFVFGEIRLDGGLKTWREAQREARSAKQRSAMFRRHPLLMGVRGAFPMGKGFSE